MKIVLFLIMYVIIPPGIFVLAKFAKEQTKQALFGRTRSNTAIQQNKKEGLNKKILNRVKFTMSDPRNKPIPFRLVFLAIYLVGAIISLFAGFLSSFNVLLISFFFHYTSIAFSYITANRIVNERAVVLDRMLQLKASKMRLVNRDKGVIATPQSEFKVVEWGPDLVNPSKMYIYMPTDFDSLAVDGFMESFNLIFGSKGQWVQDREDKLYKGFDFNSGVAAIKVTPPLPQRADWHMRYLEDENIHWSFFPLALGSENGVPVYNEETGRTEHVLGFAVNSGQQKLAKKKGVQIGAEIASAPQTLIAGATGGGKSLSTSTVINRVVEG